MAQTKLWRFNKITGYWVLVRQVREIDALAWLELFSNDDPTQTFKISAKKPRSGH